jgi:ABC-type amino acid transport system permease subunit
LAARVLLPALTSQLVVIVKDTSLDFVIVGFSEFIRAAGSAIQFFVGEKASTSPCRCTWRSRWCSSSPTTG